MKTKIYKVLSVMLTLAVVLSACFCVTGIVSASTVKTYYVASASDGGASSNDGLTAVTPLLSVNEAITKANEAGITADNMLYIKVVGTNDIADWGDDLVCNASTIKVESYNPTTISSLNPTTSARMTE